MRISDWSSDVCSSDLSSSLIIRAASPIEWAPVEQAVTTAWLGPISPYLIDTWPEIRLISRPWTKCGLTRDRKSVVQGKRVVSTCRSRWSPYHEKKKTNSKKTHRQIKRPKHKEV